MQCHFSSQTSGQGGPWGSCFSFGPREKTEEAHGHGHAGLRGLPFQASSAAQQP